MLRSDVPPFEPGPVTLEGRDVVLEPIDQRHAADLFQAGRDEAVWRFTLGTPFARLEDARAWIEAVLDEQARGDRIGFAIVDRASGSAVGSTSYLEIQRLHRTIEIGWTWIAVPYQRTHVNTQCKLALLSHAFETLGANRVQLKTHHHNVRSQRAIERIGAVREGVLRRTAILPDGSVRDSVYYSVIADEWPAVRERLTRLAARPRPPVPVAPAGS